MTTETLSKLYLELAHIVPRETQCYREVRLRQCIKHALFFLDEAPPSRRNGPWYRAADTLRNAVGLSPMKIGGKPSDGIDGEIMRAGDGP